MVVTPGEPAGVGPDLTLHLSQQSWPVELIVVADQNLLADRAKQLGVSVMLKTYDAMAEPRPSPAGELIVEPVAMSKPARAGLLDPANAPYVIATLTRACSGCQADEFAAMITGPVHKSVINQGGIEFTGHTEWLAQQTGTAQPVMLLVADEMRVALATTHIPLAEVPARIQPELIESVCQTLHHGLERQFAIDNPRIAVLGLNPHAGEGGHLGLEDAELIAPALERLRENGMDIVGPIAADTAFVPERLQGFAAVLAMYHDQGLPVLKYAGFGRSVNVTLGLPIIRTSVDHGTALDRAGTGEADAGSLVAAIHLAISMSERAR
jgi:4-hydroxythreonine-4-phosphate dehydrogenase